MTAQQVALIMPLLLALGNVRVMSQVDALWPTLEVACKAAGLSIGSKPTSIPQARSKAISIKRRIEGK